MQNLKPVTVSVLFFALLCERIFSETRSIESRRYGSEKYIVCMRVRAFFSPEILQAAAVKGLLNRISVLANRCDEWVVLLIRQSDI